MKKKQEGKQRKIKHTPPSLERLELNEGQFNDFRLNVNTPLTTSGKKVKLDTLNTSTSSFFNQDLSTIDTPQKVQINDAIKETFQIKWDNLPYLLQFLYITTLLKDYSIVSDIKFDDVTLPNNYNGSEFLFYQKDIGKDDEDIGSLQIIKSEDNQWEIRICFDQTKYNPDFEKYVDYYIRVIKEFQGIWNDPDLQDLVYEVAIEDYIAKYEVTKKQLNYILQFLYFINYKAKANNENEVTSDFNELQNYEGGTTCNVLYILNQQQKIPIYLIQISYDDKLQKYELRFIQFNTVVPDFEGSVINFFEILDKVVKYQEYNNIENLLKTSYDSTCEKDCVFSYQAHKHINTLFNLQQLENFVNYKISLYPFLHTDIYHSNYDKSVVSLMLFYKDNFIGNVIIQENLDQNIFKNPFFTVQIILFNIKDPITQEYNNDTLLYVNDDLVEYVKVFNFMQYLKFFNLQHINIIDLFDNGEHSRYIYKFVKTDEQNGYLRLVDEKEKKIIISGCIDEKVQGIFTNDSYELFFYEKIDIIKSILIVNFDIIITNKDQKNIFDILYQDKKAEYKLAIYNLIEFVLKDFTISQIHEFIEKFFLSKDFHEYQQDQDIINYCYNKILKILQKLQQIPNLSEDYFKFKELVSQFNIEFLKNDNEENKENIHPFFLGGIFSNSNLGADPESSFNNEIVGQGSGNEDSGNEDTV